MINRRRFLKTSAGSLASLLAFQAPAFAAGKRRLGNIGYITGIIGKELAGDWKAVLKRTAEFGYTEIETGRYLGESAASFLRYCNEIGLKPIAGGIGFTDDRAKLDENLDRLIELQLNYAVTYWPWQGGGPFMLEDCKKSVEILNIMGEAAHRKGLVFCWHNHAVEFAPMEEGLPFDYLMAHTDKKLVQCELDIYWVAKGGADPLKVLRKYKGRIPILHVKDMAPGPEMDFECPGSGIIDFTSIFREAARQDIRHYFVERDKVPDGMACLASAAEYLKALRF